MQEYWLFNWLDSRRWNIECSIASIVDVGMLAFNWVDIERWNIGSSIGLILEVGILAVQLARQ